MKKTLIVMLIAALVLSLSACGKKQEAVIVPGKEEQSGAAAMHTEETEESEIVTIAAFGPQEDLSLLAAKYQEENPRYTIQIKDYSDNYTVELEKAQNRLNTEIAGGNIPDMICFSGISPGPYIRKGLLSDMKELLAVDSEISIDDLAVKRAVLEKDGLFTISGTFIVDTLIGLKSRFGDRYGWTLDEYLQIEADLPLETRMIYNISEESFLQFVSQRYLTHAVDWNQGTCSFNNPDFLEILEASSRIRETPKNEEPRFGRGSEFIAQGLQITASCSLNSVWKLTREELWAENRLSTIGWPTVDGSCGSDIVMLTPVGISSQSPNKEICWEFIKFMLKNASVDAPAGAPITMENGIPMYMPLLKEKIERVQNSDEYPVKLTDEDAERFLTLLDTIDTIAEYDTNIVTIITSESGAFFNGDKTAEEVANLIESKVNIYLSEIA